MAEAGKWVHAPCRRFGGHGFEDSIYRPGRDTQQVNCTAPNRSDFALFACLASRATERAANADWRRLEAPMEAWLQYDAAEAAARVVGERECLLLGNGMGVKMVWCRGSCVVGAHASPLSCVMSYIHA